MKIHKFTFYWVLVFTIACAPIPDSGEQLMSDDLYELPDPCNFMDVYNGSAEFDCSPKLKDRYFSEFSGLLINAPKAVVWPKNVSLSDFPPGPWGTTSGPLRLMLAGLARFKYSELGLRGDTGEHVLVIAVDQKTGQSYSGKMPQPDVETAPNFDMGHEQIEPNQAEQNALLTSYFNLDLVHDLNLPIAKARYTVYATLGEFKSNIVEIETSIEE